jgi:rhamnose utilization protein RhaD (predicted bifunctional aldolase and dehydrogenase)
MKINHYSISQFCAELGQDSLLVQGAGGNVSWKDGDTLWIKGSGTWLANAKVTDIFVPVDLKKITSSLSRGDFTVTPELIAESDLRPSIETILHALMPQKVVIHLHAINPLTLLILRDARIQVASISGRLAWGSAFIEYFKPGAELAQAIDAAMKMKGGIHILFLKNHGIVIGGDSIQEVCSILKEVLDACPTKLSPVLELFSPEMPEVPAAVKEVYQPFDDIGVQQLAQNPSLYSRLHFDWALYPDHVVFLGPKAFTYKSWEYFFSQHKGDEIFPELIYIENVGVFVAPNFNRAKTVQLRCYYDVISRVLGTTMLNPLTESDITTLLNWDAEKLRQEISI